MRRFVNVFTLRLRLAGRGEPDAMSVVSVKESELVSLCLRMSRVQLK